MSTGYMRYITRGCAAVLVMLALHAAAQNMPVEPAVAEAADAAPGWNAGREGTPGANAPAEISAAAIEAPAAQASGGGSGVSEAEEYFRRGVALYKRDLYREALTEFNRALALAPNLQGAKEFQEKCNAKLQLSAGGTQAAETPSFETFDPESISAGGETPQKTADELKRERVKKLLSDAARYLEAQRNDVAVEIYSNVLLIDPNNVIAREGLHKATLGAHMDEVKDSELKVKEDRAMIRNFIEEEKTLPKGSDARGIKPYRFTVPEIEEEYVAPDKTSEIEKTLQSKVTIEFEDIHINEIVQFISDSWMTNIVIDTRAVEPPKKAQPQQAGAPMQPQPQPFQPGGAPFGAARQQQQRRPGAQLGQLQFNQPGGAGQYGTQYPPGTQIQSGSAVDPQYGPKSDGIVPYINLKEVTLQEALKALLRPLGLDFSVQPGFIWISKPEIIRQESFEPLETRFYEMRNVGSDRLFKLVIRNPFGGVGGGMGGGMGGMGGGMDDYDY